MPSNKHRRTSSPPRTSDEVRAESPPAAAPGSRSQGAFELDRVGVLLRHARERRGESLYTIADDLRIRPDFLAALENSRYDELPADAYVTGFLRTYAAYLGLDNRAVVDQYRREMAGRLRRPQLNMPQPISEGRAPTVLLLIGAAVAAVLIYALWYMLSSSGREAAIKAPVLPQTTVIQPARPLPEPAAAPPAAPSPPAPTVVRPAPETSPAPPADKASAAPAPEVQPPVE